MSSKVDKLFEVFHNNINSNSDYSLKDFQKILENSYKDVYGTKGKNKKTDLEKKPPSAYNIFIKNEIAKIRDEKPEGILPKDYMKIAAGRWKEQKSSSEDNK